MFIPLIECNLCHKTGRPASLVFALLGYGKEYKLKCTCGNFIDLPNPKDQCVLSENILTRLEFLSNYSEEGLIENTPGGFAEITFKRPFDVPARVFLSPRIESADSGFVYAKEAYLTNTKMLILTSTPPAFLDKNRSVPVGWKVYGLVGVDTLPTWYVHFYSAVAQLANGLHKAALIDYAVTFEVFLESYLVERLTRKFDKDVADLFLKKIWRVDERCKELLELVTGHRLSEQPDVYKPWDEYVRTPRNELAHGKTLSIGYRDADNAHQATYQAIRWIESLT